MLRRVSFDAQLLWTASVGSGGVLAIDLHPSGYACAAADRAAPDR